MRFQGIIERYRNHLPVTDRTPVVSLGEGSTPLIQAPALSKAIHPRLDIWLKLEGLNPTCSFKDRGMTLAVSKAVEDGFQCLMCASTGNTSAAAAAYAARAGIKCAVLIPEGNIARGKLAQAMIHGAKVIQIRGNFDHALNLVRKITQTHPIALVNSVNPFRIEGQKTGAFEIVDDFDGEAPDFHVLPVGNAGNITAYWRGYREYHDKGRARNLPRMVGYQAAGAAPIVRGEPVPDPQTFATAIRIGHPASWDGAIEARDLSRGIIGEVTDRQIKIAYKMMASVEGIFAEPASAAGVAGVIKLAEGGFFDRTDEDPHHGDKYRIVCVLTGHGLKDPDSAQKYSDEPITVEANVDDVLGAIDLEAAQPAPR